MTWPRASDARTSWKAWCSALDMIDRIIKLIRGSRDTEAAKGPDQAT